MFYLYDNFSKVKERFDFFSLTVFIRSYYGNDLESTNINIVL